MKPVTDPSLLSQLNGLGAGLKPVTDRSLLSQLDGSQRAEAVRIDDFLNQSGAPAPLPTSSFGAGISSRALGIVGDLIEGAARIGEQGGDYLERKIPLSGLSESQIQERQLDPLFKAAEWFKRQQQAINYQPSVDFQQVKRTHSTFRKLENSLLSRALIAFQTWPPPSSIYLDIFYPGQTMWLMRELKMKVALVM